MPPESIGQFLQIRGPVVGSSNEESYKFGSIFGASNIWKLPLPIMAVWITCLSNLLYERSQANQQPTRLGAVVELQPVARPRRRRSCGASVYHTWSRRGDWLLHAPTDQHGGYCRQGPLLGYVRYNEVVNTSYSYRDPVNPPVRLASR